MITYASVDYNCECVNCIDWMKALFISMTLCLVYYKVKRDVMYMSEFLIKRFFRCIYFIMCVYV
jgi:hypothetical protein